MPPLPVRLFHLSNHRNSLPLLACSPASGPEYRSPLATSHTPLTTAFLSPLFVALTNYRQLTDNPTILSPFPATLTRRVKVNPFVCNSYKKHPGDVAPSFKRQILDFPPGPRRVQSEFRVSIFVIRFTLDTHHSPPVTIPLTINTCTSYSKQTTLSLFRINVYKKPRWRHHYC